MKQSKLIKISVIIPTLNRCNELHRTIESLKKQTLPAGRYEIIVVDNGSKDATCDVVETINKEGGNSVLYIREENLGLHYARHAGAREACGEILAFMDDDAIADSKWLEVLLEEYTDSKVGCVGGKILPIWEAEPPDWVRPYGPGYLSLLDLGDKSMELRTPAIYGCNFSLRKSLLYKLRGFNPDSFGDFWLGDGETGLLRKVIETEWKIIYTPKAIVWHMIPASRMTLFYLKRRAANEGTCASYAAYRKNQPGKISLFISILRQGLRGIIFEFISIAFKLIKKDQWIHQEIRAAYHWRRVKYDTQLIFDNKLRQLVLKDDWL